MLLVVWIGSSPLASAGVLDGDGRLVQFERDIAPILRDRCLECHGAEDAKNDFRVDDLELLMDFVEPEDLESSSLYVDYLTTDDDDMMMPPASHQGPLSAGELALVRTWIQEGAVWPEGFLLTKDVASVLPKETMTTPPPATGLMARVWAFQGYFHPAAVHFPIALLSLGGLFVVLGWKWPQIGTQVPLVCLWIGAVAAIGTTAMGWSFATEQGYPSWRRVDIDSEVFWHRWSGLIVTSIAVVAAIVAAIAVYRNNPRLNKVWKVGLLAAAALVGLVGHQGGEMTYGETFYQRAFDRLWPPVDVEVPQSASARVAREEIDESDVR